MKKLFLLLMITAVVLTGCKKNEAPTADQAKGEVEFNVTNIMDDGSRTEIPGIPDCDLEAVADYAVVTITDGTNPITGSPFTMAISDIGDLMTDVLKLVPGTYFVTSFEVFTAGNDLIWAAPLAGSFYNDFMNIPLDLEFAVIAYEKHGYEVEVLCYDETVADQFGFTWFDIDKVVLRDICFFGDICLMQFPGANWAAGGYSGEFDMPAQFQLTLYRAGETTPLSVKQNYNSANTATYVDTWSVPMPLCIQYPDRLEETDEFLLELEVWQPDGSGGFELSDPYTFGWQDDAELDPNLIFGDDNVIDFYIGHCYNEATPPDYAWPEQGPADFVSFPIRNHNGTIIPLWDSDMYLIENTAGDGFSTSTPQGGQKMGYGTHQFDGVKINTISSANFDILVGNQSTPPYINMWVTDGTNYAIISSENNYRGTDFMTRQEWKVFETNTGNLDWFFDSGTGGVSAQYLTRGGVKVTLADFSDNIVLGDPGVYPSPPIGTGAPRGGYGFQLINGDTQSNYINPFIVENITVTVDGVIYYATN